ncbi:DUF4157 domain-containing protein [Sphingomonas sp.]|uniref:eCIS core domain-containing protein n=1 Tax=Sphingomonas sp. TaxID=28214 RepID=UPI0025EB75E4|nr:DUF4157 domain-containing protein [Sphingomonas sp.]
MSPQPANAAAPVGQFFAATHLPRHRLGELPAVDPSAGRNRTGLPDRLKRGVELLGGVSLDDVKVHYRSAAPAGIGARAFARGREIHVAPGEEASLPHEAWHLVQQAHGRVRATTRLDGTAINDDRTLEREADMMGRRAWHAGVGAPAAAAVTAEPAPAAPAAIAQRDPLDDLMMKHPDVAAHIFSHLSFGDLGNMAAVSKRANKIADQTRVQGGPVTRAALNAHMSKFRLTGLHGASSNDADSLVGGVTTGHASNFDRGSKLGPGFYMTEGVEAPEQEAAKHFADNRVAKLNENVRKEADKAKAGGEAASSSSSSASGNSNETPASAAAPANGGQPTIYRVFTRDLNKLSASSPPAEPWLKPDSKEMRPDHRGAGDVLKSNLTDIAKWGQRAPREMKIAPYILSPTLEEGVHPNHRQQLKDEELRQTLERKRRDFGIEVLPPVAPAPKKDEPDMRGVLPQAFLKGVATRINRGEERKEK